MSAGQRVKTGSIHWNTPPKYTIPIKEFFKGRIDLDPCSNEGSIVQAKTELYEGGLEYNWGQHKNIFVNPPYGRNGKTSIYHWLQKCYGLPNSEVIALIPVAPNTKHWKEFVFNSSIICFLSDTRLKFMIDGSTNNKGASMACCLVYWGNNKENFLAQFNSLGVCCAVIKENT